MGEQLKNADDDGTLTQSEKRVRDLLGDTDSYYIENGEVRPTREQLSKSGGNEDDGK